MRPVPRGHENCESPVGTVQIQLPAPAGSAVGCTYSVTVDWGDHSAAHTATATRTAATTLFSASHTYHTIGDAYVLSVTESSTGAHCPLGPASWRPEFALAIKQ